VSIPCYKTSAQPHPKCAPLPYPLAWVLWDDERAMVARAVVLVSGILIPKQTLSSLYLHRDSRYRA